MGLKSLRNFGFSWVRKAAFAAVLMAAPLASADMTFGTVSGVSNTDLTDLAKPIIYGGFTPGCSGDGANNTNTCDSCAASGAAVGKTCNLKNAYDALIVTFTMTATNSGYVPGTDFFAESGTKKNTTPINPAAFDGTTLTAQLTWGEICALLDKSPCDSVSGEITIGLKNTSNTDSMTIAVRIRKDSSTTSFYKDCGDLTFDGTNYGACHFATYKGDEKIYADELTFTQGYPTSSPASGIPYNGVVFFYEMDANNALSDNQLIANITTKSPNRSILVNSGSGKLADDRITGLQNDVRYCMLMANQDASGIISFFTPVDGTVPVASLCETPTKVVGLLDDKSCFIATAAFGSSMAPEVESFRGFRNHFLLTNPVGKSFVRFYYKHSPFFADMIAQSEVAKAVVRTALWPLLLFARVSLVFGIWITLFFTALGGLGIYEIYRRFFLGRRFRGEL